MSMNRPKRASSRRNEPSVSSKSGSSPPSTKPPKWKDVVGDKPDSAFTAYSATVTFAKDALVAHPKFGKGIVIEVDGNKVQILFEEGPKKLVHAS
jgi:hypothetical protein